MSFTRTSTSLLSYHLFYNVDFMVFCEGGQQNCTFDDIDKGAGNEATLDAFYWSQFLNRAYPELTFHVKSVGSKTVVLSLIEKIEEVNSKTTIVCVDRDYVNFTGRYISFDRIFLTMGYSWENDSFTKGAALDLIQSQIGLGASQEVALAEVEAFFENLDSELYCYTLHDISRHIAGRPSLFTRDKPLRYVAVGKDQPISLRVADLEAAIANDDLPNFSLAKCSSRSICFGKTVSWYIYHFCARVVRKFNSDFRMSYNDFARHMISKTFMQITGSDLDLYISANIIVLD